MATKEYLLTVPIERASGTQYYTVKAKSAKDAIRRFKEKPDECIFGHEEIEVTELGEPEASENV